MAILQITWEYFETHPAQALTACIMLILAVYRLIRGSLTNKLMRMDIQIKTEQLIKERLEREKEQLEVEEQRYLLKIRQEEWQRIQKEETKKD